MLLANVGNNPPIKSGGVRQPEISRSHETEDLNTRDTKASPNNMTMGENNLGRRAWASYPVHQQQSPMGTAVSEQDIVENRKGWGRFHHQGNKAGKAGTKGPVSNGRSGYEEGPMGLCAEERKGHV